MKKKTLYRQCVLKRNDNTEAQTSYLPEKYAIVGDVLKLKDGDVWSNGWVVEFAGELTSEPPDYRKQVKSHRHGTGDDLPKEHKNENRN